jgi:hypothetical protein
MNLWSLPKSIMWYQKIQRITNSKIKWLDNIVVLEDKTSLLLCKDF